MQKIRLSKEEIKAIKQLQKKFLVRDQGLPFWKQSLFERKEGDIDLYIKPVFKAIF